MSVALVLSVDTKQAGSNSNVASSGVYRSNATMECNVSKLHGTETPFQFQNAIWKTQETSSDRPLVHDVDEVVCVQNLVV